MAPPLEAPLELTGGTRHSNIKSWLTLVTGVRAPLATEEVKSKQPSSLKSFLCGGVGGICLLLVGHPFDTIKVRLQTMEVVAGKPPQYKGMMDCASQIIKAEGPRGLYKGMAAPLAGVAPMYALCFMGYGVGKQIFCDDDAFDSLKPIHVLQIALAGGFSTFFTTPILGPGERLKTVLQVQGSPAYTGVRYNGYKDLITGLYREGGIRSIFRGSGITCARDGVGAGCSFAVYEYLKKTWTPRGENSPGLLVTICAGGFAGCANWTAALPLDVVKSKIQIAPQGHSGAVQVARDIVVKEGINGLAKGYIPLITRAFPAQAACFLGFETASKVLTRLGME
jgi:solute carrier family 25 carnitine/acylcarnitine transporter 20/29